MANILELKPKIEVGTGDLELYFKMETMTGEVIVDKKADSLVPNFLRLLMAGMGRRNIEGNLFLNFTESLASNGKLHNLGDSYQEVSSITVGNPTTINLSSTMSRLDGAGNYGVELYGIGGVTPDINGFHPPADVTYVTDSQVQIAVDTTGSPAFVDEGARMRMWENTTRTVPNPMDFQEFLNYPAIYVGRNGTANVTDQQTLNEMFDAAEDTTGATEPYELFYSSTSISIPAFNVSTGESEIILYVVVTNNSGSSVTLNEAGLFSSFFEDSGDYYYTMLARDLISPGYALAQGASVCVTYKLKTATGSGGGFTKAFLEILYRHLSRSSFTVTDVDNGTYSVANTDAFMHLVSAAGEGTLLGEGNGEPYDRIGIQLGTGNTAMALDDYGLETRIDHGEDAGELVFYGTLVDGFDITGSVASMKLIAFFENLSGGAIGVNEFGLYVSGTYDGGGQEVANPTCIYREVLGATETVNDGAIVKVELDFELTVV